MDFGEAPGTIADSSTKRAMLGNAAQAMAADIRQAIATGQLSAAEVGQLQGVMEGLMGDVELAQAYVSSAMDIGATAKAYVDSKTGVGDNRIGTTSGNTINGIQIIDGKVGGEIPINEYVVIRQSSIKNPDSDSITLGKYTPTIIDGIEDWSKPGPDSYIVRAGKDSSYFDMGREYGKIQKQYNLSDKQCLIISTDLLWMMQ